VTDYCRDGVCCASPCGGQCESCNVAGSVGTCTAFPAGADPENECPTDPVATCLRTGACSGARSCQLYSATTVCAAPTCADASTEDPLDLCNGAGSCVDSPPVACEPYTCNATGGTCRTTCTTSLQCAAGYVCSFGICDLP
jgi:hypothetical protein